jgi:hypothetical protein
VRLDLLLQFNYHALKFPHRFQFLYFAFFVGGYAVKQKSRWEKCHITCPEEQIDTELLLEWRKEKGKKVLKSVSCKNTKLMDLSPQDCEWTCWEEIEKGKKG